MLEKDIATELKEAMKAGDKVKVSVLRLLTSEIKNKKIEDRVQELDETVVAGQIQKMVKRYKESIEKFAEGGRQDLVEKETAELSVLEQYLPEQLSEEALGGIVDKAIERTGASSIRDMGKVMGQVLGEVAGRADGSLVSKLVKSKLS